MPQLNEQPYRAGVAQCLRCTYTTRVDVSQTYADPIQQASCPIDVTKMLARFGGSHVDESSKARAGTTPAMGSAPWGETESAMTKHHLLWYLGVIALVIGMSRIARV